MVLNGARMGGPFLRDSSAYVPGEIGWFNLCHASFLFYTYSGADFCVHLNSQAD